MKLYHVLHVLLGMLVNDIWSIGLFIVSLTDSADLNLCIGTVHPMTCLREGQMRGDLTLENTTHNQYKVNTTESTFDNPSYPSLCLSGSFILLKAVKLQIADPWRPGLTSILMLFD